MPKKSRRVLKINEGFLLRRRFLETRKIILVSLLKKTCKKLKNEYTSNLCFFFFKGCDQITENNYFTKINENLNEAGSSEAPLIIVSDVNESAADSKQNNSQWHCVSDESFIHMEKLCESPRASSSPNSEYDSGYEMQDILSVSPASEQSSLLVAGESSYESTSEDDSFFRGYFLSTIDEETEVSSNVNEVEKMSVGGSILPIIDEEPQVPNNQDIVGEADYNLNNTLDMVNFIIQKGKDLGKVNFRLTLSPTRARILQNYDYDEKL